MGELSTELLSQFSSNGPLGLVGALLLSKVGDVDSGIFTRITMTSMTGCWYQPISNFEAIIVGIVILEIFVMRYMLILPLDFTKWIEQGVLLQTVLSKRKKRMISPNIGCTDGDELVKAGRLMETMFTVIQRLDQDDCFLRSLCELQNHQSRPGSHELLPPQISKMLDFIKRLDTEMIIGTWKNETASIGPPLLPLIQRSVLNGDLSGNASCANSYLKCPLKSEEIIEYLYSGYFKIM